MPRPHGRPYKEDILEVIEPGIPYTTGEIHDHFPEVAASTIARRLETLHDDGFLACKRHDPKTRTWWKPGDRHLTGDWSDS